MRKRPRESGGRDTPIDRDKVEAVIIDTNGQPGGRPDIAAIEALAEELGAEDVTVVIPEVVAWEFAEHIGADFDELRVSYQAVARRLERADIALPPLPPDSREEIQDKVLARLEAINGLDIARLEPAHAQVGLSDQVLQRGIGSKKDGVKTGAADSAWLRGVHERWPDRESVVIVSNDVGVRTASQKLWDGAPAFVSDLYTLRKRLLVHPIEEPTVTGDVVAFFVGAVTADPSEGPLGLGDVTPSSELLDELFGEHASDNFVQIDAAPSAIGPLLGIQGITASRVRGTVAAEVFVASDIDIVAWHLGYDAKLESEFGVLNDAVVAAEIVFRRDEGEIASGDAEGAVRVSRADGLYSDSSDAAWAFFEVLGLFPGMSAVEVPEFGDTVTLPVRSTGRSELEVQFDWVDDGWRAVVALPGRDDVVLSCEYDPTTRVWDGAEGFDLEGPFRLRVENPTRLAWNPLWAINAALADFLDAAAIRAMTSDSG